jgi:hypothetical protein
VGDDGEGGGLVIDMLIQFDIPGEMMTLNKLPGTPYAAKAHRALKNEWLQAAYYAAVEAFPGVGPSGRALPPCDVYVSLPVWGQRIRDAGNWTLTVKPIVDAFVMAGLWVDDGPEWVSEQPVTFRVITDRRQAMRAQVIVRLVERT